MAEIEVFLALADELHFGRTAQRLYLSQARVSQTVRALESRVGGRLFERTSRQVSLTPLGERLRDDLRPGYDQILRAFASARDSTRGVSSTLRLGVISMLVGGPHLTGIVRRFVAEHPLCTVSVDDSSTISCLDQLRDGQLDVGAVYLPLTRPELTIGPLLARHERALLVPDDHPLALRGHADAEDLADLVMCKYPGLPDEHVDVLVPPWTPSGRPAQRIVLDTVHGVVTLLSAVARGRELPSHDRRVLRRVPPPRRHPGPPARPPVVGERAGLEHQPRVGRGPGVRQVRHRDPGRLTLSPGLSLSYGNAVDPPSGGGTSST